MKLTLWFTKYSQSTPCLVVNEDHVVNDSEDILSFLEEEYPNPPMTPRKTVQEGPLQIFPKVKAKMGQLLKNNDVQCKDQLVSDLDDTMKDINDYINTLASPFCRTFNYRLL